MAQRGSLQKGQVSRSATIGLGLLVVALLSEVQAEGLPWLIGVFAGIAGFSLLLPGSTIIRYGGGFLLGVLMFVGISLIGRDWVSSTASLDEFNRLSQGMTYDTVVRIIGGPRTLQAASQGVTIYMWHGLMPGANMNATFQNGVLIAKAQIGL